MFVFVFNITGVKEHSRDIYVAVFLLSAFIIILVDSHCSLGWVVGFLVVC